MKLLQHSSLHTLFAMLLGLALGACAADTKDQGTTTAAELNAASSGGNGQTCFALNGKADRHCTPGAFNPDVTQATINNTICVVGWTSTIRPPASYTTGLKNQQKPEYGEANVSNADLEEDHLIPLELGRDPMDPNNLWPEPRNSISTPGQGAETKDTDESTLKHAVCSGQMTLADAQKKMLADWTH
jgi:hypothetical protein